MEIKKYFIKHKYRIMLNGVMLTEKLSSRRYNWACFSKQLYMYIVRELLR